MKKIMILMAISCISYCYAQAQTMRVCEIKNDKVCRLSGHKVSCYKTKYSENFKVCKNNSGYYICCETPNRYNSTHPAMMAAANTEPANGYTAQNQDIVIVPAPATGAPESQSYTVTQSNEYEGYYYPVRGRIKVCYGGNNVAELNRAPYEGCPSPASEGPEADARRNVNVSNQTDLRLLGRP